MPAETLLPYITLELVATGALAGIFAKAKLPAFVRVLSVQVAAKIIRLVAFAASLYLANGTVAASALFSGILISIPGVVLQLGLVTYLTIKKEKKLGE